MRINDIVDIHDEIVMSESSGIVMSTLRKMKGVNWNSAKKTFKKAFDQFSKTVKGEGLEDEVIGIINRSLGTSFRNLDSLSKMKVQERRMNEGLGDWWGEAAGNLYGALSFYPILTMFLELDKIIRGNDGDAKVAIIYGLMWVAIVSGKVAKNALLGRKEKAKENHVKASLHPTQTAR